MILLYASFDHCRSSTGVSWREAESELFGAHDRGVAGRERSPRQILLQRLDATMPTSACLEPHREVEHS